MPPPTLQVSLDPDAQAELERRYHTTGDAETRTRYQMVLLNAQGHTPPQIARLVRCSPDTVRRVLKRYLAGGADAVPHQPHPGILMPSDAQHTVTSRGFGHRSTCPTCPSKVRSPTAMTAAGARGRSWSTGTSANPLWRSPSYSTRRGR
jgi:hypothetical protein